MIARGLALAVVVGAAGSSIPTSSSTENPGAGATATATPTSTSMGGVLAGARRGVERSAAISDPPSSPLSSATLPTATAAERALLDDILARPEYRHAAADPRVLRRALAALWERLLELLGTEEAGRYAEVGRALYLGAAAAALLLVAIALRRRRARPAPRARAAPSSAPPAPAAPPDGSLAAARAALARGDAREAVRLALLASLGALERAGRIPRGRALTSAELVARAGAAELAPIAAAFDRAVYGGRPLAPAEATAAVDGAARIAGAAEEGR